jgi:hypothetical protein
MTENPIVDEVHRIREQMLEEFSGDLGALMKDAQRRTEEAARAGRTVVAGAPRQPRPAPAKKVG